MKTWNSKLMFVLILLGTFLIFPACSDDNDDDDTGTGGGGNAGQELLLPVKISGTIDKNKYITTFEYDDKNRITKITEQQTIDTEWMKSHSVSNINIVYRDPINGAEAVNGFHRKTEMTGSNVTGTHITEELYAVNYSGNRVIVQLVASTNSNNTEGTGTSRGTINLDTDSKGRTVKQTEIWENGATAEATFTYDSRGNIIISDRSSSFNGTTTTQKTESQFDDKNCIFSAVNAPSWFGQLPLTSFSLMGVNNATESKIYINGSNEPLEGTTIYTYNSEHYPISYVDPASSPLTKDSEWFVEYQKIE